jgi:prepilin-type N-terminal cleavage/methylation domain-containing protein
MLTESPTEEIEDISMLSTKAHKGFSLIELLIVVAIIGFIAATAVPNLLASRRAANEGSAQSSLRTISTREATYQATSGLGDYGDLASLGTATLTANYLLPALRAVIPLPPIPRALVFDRHCFMPPRFPQSHQASHRLVPVDSV